MNFLYGTDFDSSGSGYATIASNLSTRLVALDHKVVILGVDYRREQHPYPYTVVASDFKQLHQQAEMIRQEMWPDVMLMAFDIPIQRQPAEWFGGKGTALYCGLFPVEAGPLAEMEQWVSYIRKMDVGFVISKFGLEECNKAGLTNVVFLPVGVDIDFWHGLDPEARTKLRQSVKMVAKPVAGEMGQPKETSMDERFVVLTVADNHFRKNLAAGIRTMAEVRERIPNISYVIISRPHNTQLGWSLAELAGRYGVNDCTTVIHNRPPNEVLRKFYQSADAYLCTSTAEGLGLPILEAQACGVPVIGTDCTAIGELLDNGQGIKVPAEYTYIDTFGNNNRSFMDVKAAANALVKIRDGGKRIESIKAKALEFARSRNYDTATMVLLDAIQKARSS